jgi:hypothetical protein
MARQLQVITILVCPIARNIQSGILRRFIFIAISENV